MLVAKAQELLRLVPGVVADLHAMRGDLSAIRSRLEQLPLAAVGAAPSDLEEADANPAPPHVEPSA